MLSVYEVKAKKVYPGPGASVDVAEAVVEKDGGKAVYVTFQDNEVMAEYTVSTDSVYAYLAGDAEKPASGILEDYDSQGEARRSEYWKVFAMLKKVLSGMDGVA